MSVRSVFEKSIKTLNEKLDQLSSNINKVFNGTQELSVGEFKTAGINDRIRDVGILGLLDTLSNLDLCSLLSYQANVQKSLQGYKFDPENPPDQNKPELIKNAWNLQKKAYSIQSNIDEFTNSETQNINVKDLIVEVKSLTVLLFAILDESDPSSLNSSNLKKAYPSLLLSYQYMSQALTYFQNLNSETLSQSDVVYVMNYVNGVRAQCTKIQAINIYATYGFLSVQLSALNSALSATIQAELSQLNEVIGVDISKLVPSLQVINQQAVAITKYLNSYQSAVNVCQSYVVLGTTFVKIFSAIINFLLNLPVPSLYTTAGINATFSNDLQKANNFVDAVINDLTSLSKFLSLISSTISEVTNDVLIVVEDISKIVANLESCKNAPNGLADDLKNTAGELKKAIDGLNSFVQNGEKNRQNNSLTYGSYTVQIISEEIFRGTANIPRRYGIALDSNGIEVVKTTPTYASNDNVIIQEVQLLLESKKLIQPIQSSLTPNQILIIQSALAFVQDDNVDQNFDYTINVQLDSPNNEDENSGLGLNAFINNQKGGKALRKRMRAAMASASAQLQKNLEAARH